jgi:signal transduction histidine kinase
MKPPVDYSHSYSHSKESEQEFRGNVVRRTALIGGLLFFFSLAFRMQATNIKMLDLLGSGFFGLVLLSIPYFMRFPRLQTACGYALIFSLNALSITAGVANGGLRAPAIAVLVLSPIFGFLCVGITGARFGLVLSVGSVMALAVGDAWVMPLDSPEKYVYYKAIVVSICIVMGYAISAVYEGSRRDLEKKIYSLSGKMIHSAKLASLAEMSAGLAHEINNPLLIIKLKTARLGRFLKQEHFDRAQIDTEFEAINRSVEKISTIVRGLGIFSGRGEGMLASSEQNVSEIVSETVGLCRDNYNALGIELRFNGALSFMVDCRRVDVMQVLFNLLGNAVDAVRPLSDKWILVEVREFERDIELSVTDSGTGISPDVARHLMQPFFTTKEPGQGTGLGLSISRGIAESHGGSLFYDDSAKNTRFVFMLPMAHSRQQGRKRKAAG